MAVMERLKMFVVQEPVVAASCLIAGFAKGSSSYLYFLYCQLFLPAFVRPMLYSFELSKQVPPPASTDVVTGVTGKKQG